MGIDYDGYMLVGAHMSDVNIPKNVEDVSDWAEENGLSMASDYYDSGIDDRHIGFFVDDILVDDMDDVWLGKIKQHARDFKKIFGIKAKLIGTQDIW